MNFWFLFSSISALIASMSSPINSQKQIYPLYNLECYDHTQTFSPESLQTLVIEVFRNATYHKVRCNAYDVCGSSLSIKKFTRINTSKPSYDLSVTRTIACMPISTCYETNPFVWSGELDYDYPHSILLNECCDGNLCNTINNLPKTRKLLSQKIRLAQDHDKNCPEYSANFQSISINEIAATNITIEDANVNLVISKEESKNMAKMYKVMKDGYLETRWDISKLNDSSSKKNLAIFSKTGIIYDHLSIQDLIAGNKIFYMTPNMLHICNLNSENGNLTIYHSHKFTNSHVMNSILNILFMPNSSVSMINTPATGKPGKTGKNITLIATTVSVTTIIIFTVAGVVAYKWYKKRNTNDESYVTFTDADNPADDTADKVQLGINKGYSL